MSKRCKNFISEITLSNSLQMETHTGAPPNHILGYTIRSHTRLYVSYIVPKTLNLLVYIAQTAADCAVSYQHFKAKEIGFGTGTLSLVLLPPLLTFILMLSSKEQWCNPQNANRFRFLGGLVLQLLFFPFFVIYRFLVGIFWSIEALFHKDDDVEHMWCLALAEESSNSELYRLIQAYAQAAPQIVLQIYYMLTQDLFRDYETTNVQALCLVFSAINLAAITTSYQRFESEKRVGRNYPWSTPKQIEAQRKLLEQNAALRLEVERKKRSSQRTISNFPASDKIMANFRQRQNENFTKPNTPIDVKTQDLNVNSFDEADNDGVHNNYKTTVMLHSPTLKIVDNTTHDDKIQITPQLKDLKINKAMSNADRIDILDVMPDTPAPHPPQPPQTSDVSVLETTSTPLEIRHQFSRNLETSYSKQYMRPLSQLDIFKDMLLVNAQLYIKEHVPRPPKLFITRVNEQTHNEKSPLFTSPLTVPGSPKSPTSPKDVVDFFLPRPTKVVNGIEQNDFAGNTIAFFGWIAFIIMRMLSLSTFCVFYPRPFFILLSAHYFVMLLGLFLESKLRTKLNHILFYLLLSYVYIFVLLEFRVKFKHVKLWYICYLLLTMLENLTMSGIWYANEDFESWWFGFIWKWIIYSCILFLATILVYYIILKPKTVFLLVEEKTPHTDGNIDKKAPNS